MTVFLCKLGISIAYINFVDSQGPEVHCSSLEVNFSCWKELFVSIHAVFSVSV